MVLTFGLVGCGGQVPFGACGLLWCSLAAAGVCRTRRTVWATSATLGPRFATVIAFAAVAALCATFTALCASSALATRGAITAFRIAGRTIGTRLLPRAVLAHADAGGAGSGFEVQWFAFCVKALALARAGALATS